MTAPHKKHSIVNTVSDIRRSAMKAFEKREEITKLVIADYKSNGKFFNTSEGLFYFENQPAPKLYALGQNSLQLSALISDRFGINQAERREFEHIVNGLRHEAHLKGRTVEIRRLSYYDAKSGRLYVSRFDGWVYRLNGHSVLRVPNGADDVFFWDNPSWKPYQYFSKKTRGKSRKSGLVQLIFASANFSQNEKINADDQRWLFSVWLLSHFFGSLLPTKPLLLTCGEKGSGKTLAMRKWLRLIYGTCGEVTSLERGKPDGFVAAICSNPIVAFDNVDEHVSRLADHLAQAATGIAFKRRELFTTNTEIEYRPQCFIALNSRTPKFIDGRDDVLDRTLVLTTVRFKNFCGESEILREISDHRNSLWTELLRSLNRLLARTPRADLFMVRHAISRMADFEGFATAIARAEGEPERAIRVFQSLAKTRSDVLLDQEPIALCIDKWLDVSGNAGREVSSKELQQELSPIARNEGLSWPYRNAHSLGQRLANIRSNLAECFEMTTHLNSSKTVVSCFWRKTESLNRPESVVPVNQAA